LPDHPTVTTSRGRTFDTFPAAVLVFIVDSQERVLLLTHPNRAGKWEPVNGGMDAGDTVISAALREAAEEAGPDVRIRPLGVFHAYLFPFDPVAHMISLLVVCAYEGGQVVPGDDMHGSEARWWSLGEIEAEKPHIIVPREGSAWVLRRAVECYRMWKDQHEELVQPDLNDTRNKYSL
jgi:8-oxo-dGTP pyrophosphatase MutT (NUDIX family)